MSIKDLPYGERMECPGATIPELGTSWADRLMDAITESKIGRFFLRKIFELAMWIYDSFIK